MVKTETVFIVGAGGSMPYGFPSGQGLVDLILKHLGESGNTEWKRQLTVAGIHAGENPNSGYRPTFDFDAFYRLLRASGSDSIDRFLGAHPEFATLGKRAIAQELIQYELDEKLQTVANGANQDWYHYLFNQIFPIKAASFRENKLKVITFNFDRSFERSMFLVAEALYSVGEVEEILNVIPVLHVHGDLGEASWRSPNDLRTWRRDYSDAIGDGEVLASCANRIKIVHDELEQSGNFAMAREWIERAERVCFLGFGFDEQNLQRLGAPHWFRDKKVWCTRYKLGDGPKGKAAGLLSGVSAEIKWADRNWDIRTLLEETEILHQ